MPDPEDRTVVFENATERLVHVHRANLAANNAGQWERPTILLAAEGQTPVFCCELVIHGSVRVVERPPGVHIVLENNAEAIASSRSGQVIGLPAWAQPQGVTDAETVQSAITMQRRMARILSGVIQSLAESGLEGPAAMVKDVVDDLARVERGLTSIVDRGWLEQTQPIDLRNLLGGSTA